MAGLNFQTCTIINSLPKVDTSKEGVVRIYGTINDFTFVKDNCSGYKTKAADFVPSEVTIDISKVTNYGRVEIYATVEGAEPAIMANALAQKGIPFWVEFKGGTSAAEVAKLLNNSFVVGNKMFNATAAGNVITVKATGEYTRIKYARVLELDAATDEVSVVAEATVVNAGKNSFGTYSHLIKDVRLPSAANLGWMAHNADEMPVVGAKYTQYIINYKADALHTGMQAVGQKLENTTTHVFWVNEALGSTLTDVLDSLIAEEETTELDS